MQTLFLGDLVSLPISQDNSTIALQVGTEGEEGKAFQLLFESMLFQIATKELFQGKGGLLAGAGLGLFSEEGQETKEQDGNNLLALLELLQMPLMEQLRPAQGENNGESMLGTLLEDNSAANEGDPMANLLGERQKNPTLIEGGQKPQEAPFPMTIIKGEQDASIPKLSLNRETSPGLEVTGECPTGENSAKEESFSQLFSGQNPQGIDTGGGIAKTQEPPGFTSNVSFQDISEQLIQSGKLKLLGERKEIELQLKPEYLGRLALKVTVENGTLMARFLVENHQVGRMLDQNLAGLRQTLGDQGINLEQVQVEVGDPRGSFQEQQKEWSRQGSGKQAKGEQFEPIEVQEEMPQNQTATGKKGIDYRA